ncbi:McrC family protein [Gordonia sp. WA4-43]|uniref:McrC family protein n=1 Tax=Gordonia sp. WA4-43 TaxID=2878678 RepID=UPI001CFBFF43|nr:McrC family protein [Gordonia sp. WA4-43]UCZ90704.1 McrC family protein [Gordonia sp. WA4-43]
MIELELPEYGAIIAQHPPILIDQQERITADLGKKLSVRWLSNDRVEVKATSWVGTVQLTDSLRVRVIPKLAGGSLGVLTMLALTDGAPLHELPTYYRGLSTNDSEDAVQLLCRLTVRRTEDTVRRGLIRDYRPHRDDLPYLRGRLDVYRQVTHHYGRLDALSCSFDEFDHDVIENQVLLAGVRVARRVASDPDIRRRAASLSTYLATGVRTLPSNREVVARPIVYGRRTEHYRAAHTWCRALLSTQQVDDSVVGGSLAVNAFLINMNTLFERFLEWLVTASLDGTHINVQKQKHNRSLITVNGVPSRSIAPDIVLQQQDWQCAVDAKYKRYDIKDVSPSDLYQLFLYAQCYTGLGTVPTSFLVHPTISALTTNKVELTVPSDSEARRVRVQVIGVPLVTLVEELRTGVSDVLARTTMQFRSLFDATTE